jgi:hypothetical protein
MTDLLMKLCRFVSRFGALAQQTDCKLFTTRRAVAAMLDVDSILRFRIRNKLNEGGTQRERSSLGNVIIVPMRQITPTAGRIGLRHDSANPKTHHPSRNQH